MKESCVGLFPLESVLASSQFLSVFGLLSNLAFDLVSGSLPTIEGRSDFVSPLPSNGSDLYRAGFLRCRSGLSISGGVLVGYVWIVSIESWCQSTLF